MATPGDLIRKVAEVTGIPEVTVGSYYRSLRQADLVTKGGRGLSAARMTPQDAARLLLACGGARFGREEAASIVRSLDQLASHRGIVRADEPEPNPDEKFSLFDVDYSADENEGRWVFAPPSLGSLMLLEPGHTPGQAIAAMIEEAMVGGFAASAEGENDRRCEVFISCHFNSAPPTVLLEIDFLDRVNRSHRSSEVHYASPSDSPKSDAGDLAVTREFSQRTIMAVADLLRSGGE